jgi:excisionase family DNA binding protein
MTQNDPTGLPVDLIAVRAVPDLLPRTSQGRKVSLKAVYRWIADGRLPSWRLGRRYYVSAGDVRGLMRPVAVKPVPTVQRCEGHAEAMRQLRAMGLRV